MIRIDSVSKSFGLTNVLSDLSFEIPEGSTTALLGLSGSGKTTLLKLVCGLHFPDAGKISINNEVLRTDTLTELRKKMGYVIQDGGLFPHLTAYANLAIVGKQAGFSKNQIDQRVAELAELTKISSVMLARYPREISGGQKQRIGIMRALFLDPPILLLDEPFGALDPITRSQLQTELKEIFRKMRKTVLLVTHDLFEAGFLAERILLLNHGQIAQAGSLQELMQKPADDFVKLFVNSHRQLNLESAT